MGAWCLLSPMVFERVAYTPTPTQSDAGQRGYFDQVIRLGSSVSGNFAAQTPTVFCPT